MMACLCESVLTSPSAQYFASQIWVVCIMSTLTAWWNALIAISPVGAFLVALLVPLAAWWRRHKATERKHKATDLVLDPTEQYTYRKIVQNSHTGEEETVARVIACLIIWNRGEKSTRIKHFKLKGHFRSLRDQLDAMIWRGGEGTSMHALLLDCLGNPQSRPFPAGSILEHIRLLDSEADKGFRLVFPFFLAPHREWRMAIMFQIDPAILQKVYAYTLQVVHDDGVVSTSYPLDAIHDLPLSLPEEDA